MLEEVARRFAGSLRTGDFFGRLGGEEFLVILSPTDEERVEKVIERMRKACAESPVETTAGPLEITVSLGAAIVDDPEGLDLSTVLTTADEALYEAKSSGRNRGVWRTIGGGVS